MGPPSRYTHLASEPALVHPTLTPKPVDEDVDTESLTNSEWAKYHLMRLATTSSVDDFRTCASESFARQVNITVNGLHLSRDLYALQWGAAFGTSGDISFTGSVETPHVRVPMLQNAALVGLLYDAIFSNSGDRLDSVSGLVSPFNVSMSSSINIIIAEDKSLPNSTSDRRRIFSVNQVISDRNGLLTFPLREL
ncbi:hypothetical protein EW145_g2493 [Phellinidium pouzarii]|uniref:Uncharacterized protein n=1 Tax=Phellinidium pouzarii TaxID=167371 RepID=A0A4S4LB45_9AGAM|nr:hypothetical protein EW145_g2493 [Phellinidium pouzarii]